MRRPGTPPKPRAVQGDLRNLTHQRRELLQQWFREKEGTLPYKEIARRLKSHFDLQCSTTSLSQYYHDKFNEITKATTKPPLKAIVIRVEVPPGCRVDLSTEPEESR